MKNVTYKLPETLIEKIDKVHNEFGIFRSKLVEKAVESYINNEGYLDKPKYAILYFKNEKIIDKFILCSTMDEVEVRTKIARENLKEGECPNYQVIQYKVIKKY